MDTSLHLHARPPYLPYRFLHRVNAKKFHGKEQILYGGFDGFSRSEFTGSFTDVISLFSRSKSRNRLFNRAELQSMCEASNPFIHHGPIYDPCVLVCFTECLVSRYVDSRYV